MTPLSDLEVMRLSAKACGYVVEIAEDGIVWIGRHDGRSFNGREVRAGGLRWTPFTNDSQRWECVRKLQQLANGQLIGSANHHKLTIKGITESFWCPAEEFPARALAELEIRDDR